MIRKILQHLRLWEPPQRSPPPPLFPLKLEAFWATLTPRQAQQVRASTDSAFWDDVPRLSQLKSALFSLLLVPLPLFSTPFAVIPA